MVSLWQQTGPVIATDEFTGQSRDVIVIGAGLTGLATAVLLARAQLRVTVLEAREVGAVTTGNTTGKLSLLQATVFSDILEHSGEAALGAYAEANREGQSWVIRYLESCGLPVDWRSAYTYASAPDQRELLDAEAKAAALVGIEVEVDADTGLPFETFGSLSLAKQVQLQPMDLLGALAAELRSRGGEIVEHCPVRRVEEEADSVRISTDQGVIEADRLVVATGSPILDRGRFFAKLEGSRSYVAAYRVSSDTIPQGMYVAAGSPQHSFRTALDRAGEQLLIVGGESHVPGRATDTREHMGEIDASVAAWFPAAQKVAEWAAQDYRMHSGLPFAGKMPGTHGHIFTATGFNKWGMTNAAAAALAIAGEMLDGNMWWADELQNHASGTGGTGRAIRANLEVAGRAVGGWVRAETRSITNLPPLEDGEGVVVRDGLHPVGIASVDGRTCAVSAVCPHMGGVLSWNRGERTWDCPLHASRFTADGTRLEGPALSDLDTRDFENRDPTDL